MLDVPAKSEFPLQEQGATAAVSQPAYLKQLKTDGCVSCHQLGNKPTREIIPTKAPSTPRSGMDEARDLRADGGQMDQQLTALGRNRTLKMFADSTIE